MKPRKSAYLMHRWLALIVSLQLLAWSAGGFVFSISPIDAVRGEREIGAAEFDPLAAEAIAILPPAVRELTEAQVAAGRSVGSVALVDRGLGARWELRDTHGEFLTAAPIDATGEAALLSPADAERVALRDFAPQAAVSAVTLIEADPPIEYRSGPLPAYRVELDHEKRPHLYVDARSGAINARRNGQWRIFDFFWMLHTMDYAGRDNFNHLLLTVFSVLAMLTALSGLTLWVWRAISRISRRWRSSDGRIPA